MGIDADYQALPEGSALMAYALAHPDPAGSTLYFAFRHFREPDPDDETYFSEGEPEEREVLHLAHELMQQHPGLEKRHYNEYSRSYDMLSYLLSPSERARVGFIQEYDLGTTLVRGAEPLGELKSGRGYALRWTPPATVQSLVAWLAPMSKQDLLQHFDPEAMHGRVYKFYADRADEWRNSVWDHFTGLRKFYQTVAAHDEGVLVTFW